MKIQYLPKIKPLKTILIPLQISQTFRTFDTFFQQEFKFLKRNQEPLNYSYLLITSSSFSSESQQSITPYDVVFKVKIDKPNKPLSLLKRQQIHNKHY